jgi:hypothetical protein
MELETSERFTTLAVLAVVMASSINSAQAQRIGITADQLLSPFAGDTLHVRPGMVHSHRNASSSDKLVFLEFVIVEKGQRSTVPMP